MIGDIKLFYELEIGDTFELPFDGDYMTYKKTGSKTVRFLNDYGEWQLWSIAEYNIYMQVIKLNDR